MGLNHICINDFWIGIVVQVAEHFYVILRFLEMLWIIYYL